MKIGNKFEMDDEWLIAALIIIGMVLYGIFGK